MHHAVAKIKQNIASDYAMFVPNCKKIDTVLIVLCIGDQFAYIGKHEGLAVSGGSSVTSSVLAMRKWSPAHLLYLSRFFFQLNSGWSRDSVRGQYLLLMARKCLLDGQAGEGGREGSACWMGRQDY